MMDPSKIDKKVAASLLDCSICLDTYNKPKVLPCGHTFCLSCLLDLPLDADRITCPQCRKLHKIPNDDMEQFPDNFALISMLDNMLSSHQPKSVCEACGEHGHNEFCSHCLSNICGKCCALHNSLMSEIKDKIESMHKFFYLPETVNKINKNTANWQTSLTIIVRERAKMEKYFTRCIEVMENRRKLYNDYFDTLDTLHNIFLRCTDLQASELIGDKLRENLMKSRSTCRNTKELEDIKTSVSELLELSQIMFTMKTGDNFTFVADVTTISASLGEVTLRGNPLEIRGKPCSDANNEVIKTEASEQPRRDGSSSSNSIKGESDVAVDQSCHDEDHPVGDAAAACDSVPVTKCLQVNYYDKGTSAKIIPSDATGDCSFSEPTGAAYCSHTNTILVAVRSIVRYDMDGSNDREFVKSGGTVCEKYTPWDVAISQSGRVFVTDCQNQRVVVFTRDGDYVTSIGSRGTGGGKFGDVKGITCHNGHVLVCDRGKDRVTMFTESGDFIRHIASGLSNPYFVAVGPGETIYVTTSGKRIWDDGRVNVYGWDGRLLRQFGHDVSGCGVNPRGVTVDAQGYVCVAWSDRDRVVVYNSEGEPYTSFGKIGSGPCGLKSPQGLELLPDGRIVVCDYRNGRLQIF